MEIPLNKTLKRQIHKEVAALQDEATEIVYSVLPEATLHGGTAIWRCYSGKRFSEDLDFYAKAGKTLKDQIGQECSKRNLEMTKYRQTENTIFSKISDGKTSVGIEIALRNYTKKEVRSYDKADGSTMEIFTLSPEELLLEKMNAYTNRKLIRDLYDVMFLSSKITPTPKIMEEAEKFLKNPPKPLDEKNLKTILYSGICPSYSQMIDAIKRRLHE
ncbi:MAG TPA: nucleotidyl transferase AbiEii/AbiGii toxin family protein [archaeon]|nr:nucleotidyl transferase AbiEii/AbiGii toxin family protein [archaeon]